MIYKVAVLESQKTIKLSVPDTTSTTIQALQHKHYNTSTTTPALHFRLLFKVLFRTKPNPQPTALSSSTNKPPQCKLPSSSQPSSRPSPWRPRPRRTGTSKHPTGTSRHPTGTSRHPTGISRHPTGTSRHPTCHAQDNTPRRSAARRTRRPPGASTAPPHLASPTPPPTSAVSALPSGSRRGAA